MNLIKIYRIYYVDNYRTFKFLRTEKEASKICERDYLFGFNIVDAVEINNEMFLLGEKISINKFESE